MNRLITQPVCRTEKLISWDVLMRERELARQQAKIVVWTNGCFDLLHVGHVRCVQTAKSLGDILVVGVNSDESVRQLKGVGRPITPLQARTEVLCALSCVDYVVVFDELTPELALERLKPEIHCKGEDYAPPRGREVPEERLVRKYGGRIEFVPLVPSLSTSQLIRTIQNLRDDDSES
jgi:glycerol-3-phosphate cytidylyltransferase